MMSNPNAPTRLAIWCDDDSEQLMQSARALASHLAMPLVTREAIDQFDLLLAVTHEGLQLREPARALRPGFAVDFSDLSDKPPSRKQPLAKAFGTEVTTILDATAGWGRDAYLLAQLGYHVTAVERSPIVAALLKDGVTRTARGVLDRLTIIEGDARELMRALDPKPDAVFIDPMYPPKRKKSALPRKSIALLRQLVGNDEDARELFDAAMANATRRVVVKRADDAPLLAPNPTVTHAGNTVRYDVYVTC